MLRFERSRKPDFFFSLSVIVLVLYLFFDYILKYTAFQSQVLVYLMMIFNFLSIGYCFLKSKHIITKYVTIWLPFMIYHMFSLIVTGYTTTLPYWMICVMMLYMPIVFHDNFNPKILVLIGVFFSIGILFQILIPNAYYSYIYPLFIGDASDFIDASLDKEFGFSGFCYQTGAVSYAIIIGEITLLSFGKDLFPKRVNFLYYISLGLFVVGILLTGKRMPSAISIFLLFFTIYLNSSSSLWKKTGVLISVAIISLFGFKYFVSNLDLFAENVFLTRFATTYDTITSGGDISSGRSELYEKAWSLYYKKPILGIGAGNFVRLSGMEMAVHNTYLQVLCEDGIIGFILYILPIVIIYLRTWNLRLKSFFSKHNEQVLTFSLLIQTTYLLYSLTGNCTIDISNFVIYFIGITMFIYVQCLSKTQRIKINSVKCS